VAGNRSGLVVGDHEVPWCGRIDSGPNWSKGETPVREPGGDLLDPVELGVEVRVGGLLPGAGALERDVVAAQQLPQPFPADDDAAARVGGQVVGELTDAPVRQRAPQGLGPRGGRRDDEPLVVCSDAAGTADEEALPPLLLVTTTPPPGSRMRAPPRSRSERASASPPSSSAIRPPAPRSTSTATATPG